MLATYIGRSINLYYFSCQRTHNGNEKTPYHAGEKLTKLFALAGGH